MTDCEGLWGQLVALSPQMNTIRVSLFNDCPNDVLKTIHKAFYYPAQRGAAFELIHWMGRDKRSEFLPELVELASYANRYTSVAREVILGLPRRWLIENIQAAYEPIVRGESAHEEEFGLLLSLLEELDSSLAKGFALRATKHQKEEVRNLGTAYLLRR
jgi:hypothetical protein